MHSQIKIKQNEYIKSTIFYFTYFISFSFLRKGLWQTEHWIRSTNIWSWIRNMLTGNYFSNDSWGYDSESINL